MKVRETKKYISPEITVVILDREISLQLASTEDANPSGEPTGGGWDGAAAAPQNAPGNMESYNDDPYQW